MFYSKFVQLLIRQILISPHLQIVDTNQNWRFTRMVRNYSKRHCVEHYKHVATACSKDLNASVVTSFLLFTGPANSQKFEFRDRNTNGFCCMRSSNSCKNQNGRRFLLYKSRWIMFFKY